MNTKQIWQHIKHYSLVIYGKIVCLIIGHNWIVRQRLQARETELLCQRCPKAKLIPVFAGPMNGISTDLQLNEQSGLFEFRILEMDAPVMIISYNRSELIIQGQTFLKVASRTGKRVKIKDKKVVDGAKIKPSQTPTTDKELALLGTKA